MISLHNNFISFIRAKKHSSSFTSSRAKKAIPQNNISIMNFSEKKRKQKKREEGAGTGEDRG